MKRLGLALLLAVSVSSAAQTINPTQVRGTAVVQNSTGTQTITLPVNTDLNVVTSGTGAARHNGNPLIDSVPTGDQVITQPAGTAFKPNRMCAGTDAKNVKGCYNAKGDFTAVGGCLIGAASVNLTCTLATFTSADIGKDIYVEGAGASGGSLVAKITAVTGSTAATLNTAAITAVTTFKSMAYGTDDTAAIQAAINFQRTAGGAVYFPAGNYLHHGLNMTGLVGKIYADNSAALFAIAVTNPGAINPPGAQTVGIDISGSQTNELDGLIIFGGYPFLKDLAPKINVFAARSGMPGTPAFAIEHVFTSDFFSTSGPYNVVLYGYEQTDFLNCQWESTVPASNLGLLYLSSFNTPGFFSPYVNVQAPLNSMTKVVVHGGRSTFAGAGNLIVLDQGTGGSDYAIAIKDAYMVFNGTSGVALSDTGSTSGFGLRHIVLDNVYVEGASCTNCAMTNIFAPAWNWNINNVAFYTGLANTIPVYNFSGGFLDGNVLVDSSGNNSGIQFSTSSCQGSVLHLGEQQPTTGCLNYAYLSGTSGVVGTNAGVVNSTVGYKYNGLLGITGNLTAGSCVIHVQGGVITSTTGTC